MNEILPLLADVRDRDANGYLVETALPPSRQIFAKVAKPHASEFFDAQRAGFEMQAVFTVYAPDYRGEKLLLWGPKKYRVIREYYNGDFIELHCTDAGRE